MIPSVRHKRGGDGSPGPSMSASTSSMLSSFGSNCAVTPSSVGRQFRGGSAMCGFTLAQVVPILDE